MIRSTEELKTRLNKLQTELKRMKHLGIIPTWSFVFIISLSVAGGILTLHSEQTLGIGFTLLSGAIVYVVIIIRKLSHLKPGVKTRSFMISELNKILQILSHPAGEKELFRIMYRTILHLQESDSPGTSGLYINKLDARLQPLELQALIWMTSPGSIFEKEWPDRKSLRSLAEIKSKIAEFVPFRKPMSIIDVKTVERCQIADSLEEVLCMVNGPGGEQAFIDFLDKLLRLGTGRKKGGMIIGTRWAISSNARLQAYTWTASPNKQDCLWSHDDNNEAGQ